MIKPSLQQQPESDSSRQLLAEVYATGEGGNDPFPMGCPE